MKNAPIIDTHVSKVIVELRDISRELRTNRRDLVSLRFKQGMALKGILGNTEYGSGVVAKIAEECDEHLSMLYRSYHLAEAFKFKQKAFEAALKQWDEEGRSITYSKFEREYIDTSNPKVYGGTEQATEHFLGQAEHAAHSLEQAAQIAGATDEVRGTAMMVADSIERYEARGLDFLPWKRREQEPDPSETIVCIADGAVHITTYDRITWGHVVLWMNESDLLASATNFLEQQGIT